MENNIIRIGTQCNAKLYEELKPILESFGYSKYNSESAISDWEICDKLLIGYNYEQKYFGNISNIYGNIKLLPKEEFLKQAAAIMGKEYNYKSDKQNKENIEKKYSAIKCDKKLWNEIKPVLESFGITNCNIIEHEISKKNCILLSNYGSPELDKLFIATMVGGDIDYHNSKLRYVVDTKEEFLSGVAKLLGKEYPISENNNNSNKENNMEKINIVKKLKYCKKGTKLYSPLFGEVEFEKINNNLIYVIAFPDNDTNSRMFFDKYGRYFSNYKNSECFLFPSKDNRDWNNFQVLEEDHRVMCSDDALYWTLCKYSNNNAVRTFTSEIKVYWKYIVSIEDFDFTAEDISVNKEKSIV